MVKIWGSNTKLLIKSYHLEIKIGLYHGRLSFPGVSYVILQSTSSLATVYYSIRWLYLLLLFQVYFQILLIFF